VLDLVGVGPYAQLQWVPGGVQFGLENPKQFVPGCEFQLDVHARLVSEDDPFARECFQRRVSVGVGEAAYRTGLGEKEIMFYLAIVSIIIHACQHKQQGEAEKPHCSYTEPSRQSDILK
jgi:hypothetical protein